METVRISGVNISNVTSNELNQELLQIIRKGRKEMILNVNIHAMNIAHKNLDFKETLNNAAINFCDGDGVRLGARILGLNIKEKITYNRWIWDFAAFCESNNISWYLLGSNDSTIHQAFDKLKHLYPNLDIKGYHHGYLNDELSKTVIDDIKSKKPNVLITGMGMPLQEAWLQANWELLDINIALTGGAVFDYISGEAKMTPDMFYKLKLEWFYRFLNDPVRLFKRYFLGNFMFVYNVLREKLKS